MRGVADRHGVGNVSFGSLGQLSGKAQVTFDAPVNVDQLVKLLH